MNSGHVRRLENPLLATDVTGRGLGLGSSIRTKPSFLINPLLKTDKNKDVRGLSLKEAPILASRGEVDLGLRLKPASAGLKQESSSAQPNRLLLGSKLTPLTSSVLGSSSLKTGSLLAKPSTYPPTYSIKSSKTVSLKNTLIKSSLQTQKTKSKPTNRLSASQPSASRQSKKDVEDSRQILDVAATSYETPNYDFHLDSKESNDLFWDLDEETCFEGVDPEVLSLQILSEDANTKKMSLINLVSSSLVSSPKFTKPSDETRKTLMKNADAVIQVDPEFLLKVALYTRRDLNIRSAANFLLALASNRQECRPYLKKYFKSSIILPSDWANVADLYLSFHDKDLSYKSLPSALRKVMVAKFPDFDTYQLGKYNKKPKKKKVEHKKTKSMSTEDDHNDTDEDDEKEDDKQDEKEDDGLLNFDTKESDPIQEVEENTCYDYYTLKQLIRKLHIMEPVENVMCLVGKKYPENLESFYKTRLPGTWDPDRAGKRMKLPTPETWETQVSLKGNKASTWENLIDHKKLPFMAMLRNLRNMLQAGVGPKYNDWIIRKLTNQSSVINSKQFPVRFFSAYDVLDTMLYQLEQKEKEDADPSAEPQNYSRGRGRGRGQRGGRGRGKIGGRGGGFRKDKRKDTEIKYTRELLARYRKALDTAVKIATRHNIKPIHGKTYLFCDVGPKMDMYSRGAPGVSKARESAILLGLMCKHSCEDCMLMAYGINDQQEIKLEKGTILDNIKSIIDYAKAAYGDDSHWSAEPSNLNMTTLYDALRDRIHIDNLIIVGQDYSTDGTGWDELEEFVVKYRQVVNPNLLFVRIDLIHHFSLDTEKEKKVSHPNDIRVMGYSDNILRFIAERGDSGQLNHVENIDKAYGLRELQITSTGQTSSNQAPITGSPENPLPIVAPVHRWRTARVFISSTFRDMHGERDLLTRFVFPELRARAKKIFLNVFEVDLRWGVTEEDTRQNRSLEICLTEASRCNYFIGLLGERYGFCPDNYIVPATEEFDWLLDYPRGRSVTELEMQHAALNDPQKHVGKAFFYFREGIFMADVPSSCQLAFQPESDVAIHRMDDLKQRIRSSGLEVFDGYPCRFGGVVDHKPVTTNLEELGLRVVNNLWQSFLVNYPQEETFLDELAHEGALHQAFLEAHAEGFSGRKSQIRQCVDLMDSCRKGLLVISGKSGCGKTALMSCLAQRYKDRIDVSEGNHVLVHFVGASVGSSNIQAILRRLCLELKKRFSLTLRVPEDFNKLVTEFPEFLKAAAVHCGSSPLVIFLDGLDQMEEAYQAGNMEWLPKDVPKDAMFVVSTVIDSQTHKALLRRDPLTVTLGPLDLLDKATVVRRMLAVHRKTLDESPFNNQMKLLVSKREANLPLFLSLACEELRVFGIFEQVSERLKRMSHTVSALLQEVMQRLEVDLGKDLIATSLALLVCARDGLLEDELHSLLSLHCIMGDKKYSLQDVKMTQLTAEQMLPLAVFAQLLRSLHGFLRPVGEQCVNHLSLAHGDISRAIKQRYMKGTGVESETRLHALLAGYFLQEADPLRNGTWVGRKPRAFSEVSYHLSCTSAYVDLQAVLCSLPFIYAKCRMGLAFQLLDDFVGGVATNRVALREREKFLAKPQVQEFRSFVSRNLHIISNLPALTWQQAANEPSESTVCKSMKAMIDGKGGASRQSLILWKNKKEEQEECAMTVAGFNQAITCVAISSDGQFVACGNGDCTVKLFERETAKEVKSFVGHFDAITDCCFVGRKRLVTASVDETLSLWDVNQGHRIAVLKGHRRRVSACCHSNTSSMVVSASWDCTLKLWDDTDGRLLDTLNDVTPINCVAFHPEGRLVMAGGWDSTIKIWHVDNKKRLGILRGHTASVRAVQYSPSGAHVASASQDGTVKIWSSKTGTQVGGLDGHVMPVNRLAFSPSGRQLVTVSDDQSIKVWSGNLGRKLSTFGMDRYGNATATAISPDGMQVATGYHGGAIRLYETNSSAEIWEVTHHQARVKGLRWVMTPGGQLEMLVGWESGDVALMSATNGSIKTILASHLVGVTSIAYSIPNRLAVATFADNTIHVWRVPYDRNASKKTLDCYTVIHATCDGAVLCCGFNMDGTRLATGSKDASLQVWSMEMDYLSGERGKNLRPLEEIHACHKDWVTALCWSDTSNYLVTASNDFTLKIWDMKTMKEKSQLMGHTSAINAVAFSQGCVVSACFDGSVRVWSHKGIEITTLYGHKSRANACDIFVSAKKAENIFEDLEVKETQALTLNQLSWSSMVATEEWKDQHEKKKLDKVELVRLENVIVATAGDDAMTYLWKPLQGNEMASLSGHSDSVLAVAVSNKDEVITGSADKTMKIWTPKLETQSLPLRHNGEVTCTAYSTKGTYAVSTSRNGEVMVWKMPEKGESVAMLPQIVFSNKVCDKSINAVCFLSNARFALGSDEGIVTVWEIEVPTSPTKTWRVQHRRSMHATNHDKSPITCMAYDPVRDNLYTGHWSAMICMFRCDSGKLRRVYERGQDDSPDWILDLKLLSDNTLVASFANGELQHFKNLELDSECRFSIVDHVAKSLSHRYQEPCWIKTCTGLKLTGKMNLGLGSSGSTKAVLSGDSKGYLSVVDVVKQEVILRKKVHTHAVNDITVCDDVICTASEDGALKLWSRKNLKQVGQFYGQAPVSTVTASPILDYTELICGDKLGNIYLLQWHSKC